jgi:hypothetical protein
MLIGIRIVEVPMQVDLLVFQGTHQPTGVGILLRNQSDVTGLAEVTAPASAGNDGSFRSSARGYDHANDREGS